MTEDTAQDAVRELAMAAGSVRSARKIVVCGCFGMTPADGQMMILALESIEVDTRRIAKEIARYTQGEIDRLQKEAKG